jgi:hypothetical protein
MTIMSYEVGWWLPMPETTFVYGYNTTRSSGIRIEGRMPVIKDCIFNNTGRGE